MALQSADGDKVLGCSCVFVRHAGKCGEDSGSDIGECDSVVSGTSAEHSRRTTDDHGLLEARLG